MAADYPDVIAAMARAGRLGQKSGAGFYAWSRGSDGRLTRAEDPQADRLVEGLTGGVVKTLSEAEITERLMLPTLLEAICALEEGVVGSAAELDLCRGGAALCRLDRREGAAGAGRGSLRRSRRSCRRTARAFARKSPRQRAVLRLNAAPPEPPAGLCPAGGFPLPMPCQDQP